MTSKIITPKPRFIPKNFTNLTGRTFSRWTVLASAGRDKRKSSLWLCRCECGNTRIITSAKLNSGHSKSCGCLRRDNKSKVTHGEASQKYGKVTPEYRSYHHAKERCNNPNDKSYHRYGARGIQFRFNSYEEFVAEVGRKPTSEHSLNRINNDGHYESGNVEWATPIRQARNTRKTIMLSMNGITKPLQDWADEYNIPAENIKSRLKYGYCVTCAITNGFKEKCTH